MADGPPGEVPRRRRAGVGVRPELPDHLADLFERPERTEIVANDLAVVEDLVEPCQSRVA